MTTDTKKERIDDAIKALDDSACACGGELHDIFLQDAVTEQEANDQIERAISEIECFAGSLDTALKSLKALR